MAGRKTAHFLENELQIMVEEIVRLASQLSGAQVQTRTISQHRVMWARNLVMVNVVFSRMTSARVGITCRGKSVPSMPVRSNIL